MRIFQKNNYDKYIFLNSGIGTKIRVCPTMKEAIVTDILDPKVQAIAVSDIAELRISGVEIDEVAPINMISRINWLEKFSKIPKFSLLFF